jgi:hypothetical protein
MSNTINTLVADFDKKLSYLKLTRDEHKDMENSFVGVVNAVVQQRGLDLQQLTAKNSEIQRLTEENSQLRAKTSAANEDQK